MRKKLKEVSIKSRLLILLLVSSVLPIFLVWGFTSFFIYNLYKANTDGIIENELQGLKENIITIMENIKHVSQQFSNDEEAVKDLRNIINQGTSVAAINSRKSLNTRIAVYEVSNPYINNTTYFYLDDESLTRVNQSSLVKNIHTDSKMMLSMQNQLSYYGPHQTMSVVSDYQVISMIREIKLHDMPKIYLYIESGYRQMDDFSTVTLDRMNAIYSVVSDTGKTVYSSNTSLLEVFSQAPEQKNGEVKLGLNEYIIYSSKSDDGWYVQAFVPKENYYMYTTGLSLGFILIAILAVVFSLAISGAIWNSVNRPFKQFDQNLKKIMADDISASIKAINVTEFDRNFEYLEKMKKRIIYLVEEAQRQEKEKSQLEIKQLLTKINPHFIHNTLDTLKWHSKQQNYTDVETFVSSMNRLMMYNMEKDKITTLKSELQAIHDYIILQKYKYELEYSTEIDLPEPMLLSEMPRFILQPLVENAIFHGIEGNGIVGIRARLTDTGKILIQVYNNGYPMDVEKMKSIINSASDLSSNGIGLQYVVKMLEAQFTDSYSFRFSVENDENRIEIIIPFQKGEYYAKDIDS